ncbi:MAG: glycosyltransferase [Calditrichaeota bacterium]|nr:MAG: glycosyltransferase [Calditrichota bacterium]
MQNILMIAYTTLSTDARVLKEIRACIERNYTVDVMTLREKSTPKNNYVKDFNLIRVAQMQYKGNSFVIQSLSYLLFFLQLLVLVPYYFFKKKYCVIHVNNMPNFLVFVTFIPKLFGTKIILDIHDLVSLLFKEKFERLGKSIFLRVLRAEEKYSMRFADRLITVHELLRDEIAEKYAIDSDRLTVVANFADEEIFMPISDFKHGLPLKLVFHGTIANRFGLDDILVALASLPRAYRRLALTIIGKGEAEGKIHRLIKQLQLGEMVNFINRFIPLYELPRILREYHLGLVSYKWCEATMTMLPVKMLELCLMGIPVITIPNKAIRYYFHDTEYFSYDPRKMNTLTKLLIELQEKPESILNVRSAILEKGKKLRWGLEKKKYQHLIDSLIRR